MRLVAPTVVALVALFLAGMAASGGTSDTSPLIEAAPDDPSAVAGPADAARDLGLDVVTSTPSGGMAGVDRADLVLAMVEPASFRPDELSLADQPAMVIADLLYDGLTEIDGHTGALEPALAQSWTADESFLRWTFELDRAAGVTADDVVVALSPLVTGPEGRQETSQTGPALVAAMASVTAVEDHVVVIELVRPNAGLAWILSGLPYSIIGVDGSPTGDFEIARDDGLGLLLQRRADRLGPQGIDGSGVDSIEVHWRDDLEAYRLLVDGRVDGAIVGPASLADAERRFDAVPAPSTAVRFYVLNPNAEELAVLDRRAELVARVDQAGLVEAADRADLIPLDGLVSPALVGFEPAGCGATCPGPAGGSSDSTAGAGWPSEVPLQVTYAGPGQRSVARALAGQLDRAGIPARSSEATARQLAGAIVEGSPALFAFGWVAPAGSVDAVLPPLLRAESAANVARFSSPGLEDLLDEAAVTEDDDARWALLDRAHQLAVGEARVLPVAVSTGTMVWSPEVSGVVQRPDGSIDLESSS